MDAFSDTIFAVTLSFQFHAYASVIIPFQVLASFMFSMPLNTHSFQFHAQYTSGYSFS
jgi:hypothetical protein